eukprot:Sspe_Gene.42920::Locus_20879_Transcript_1_1_Confidence_1.000_Length_610::g.42920::m.42920
MAARFGAHLLLKTAAPNHFRAPFHRQFRNYGTALSSLSHNAMTPPYVRLVAAQGPAPHLRHLQQHRALSLNPFAKKPAEPVQEKVEPPKEKDYTPPPDDLDDDDIDLALDKTFIEIIDEYWDAAMNLVSPLRWCNSLITSMHDYIGLEWWLSISVVASIFRLFTVPFALISTRNNLRS